jgi:hypothetical protein
VQECSIYAINKHDATYQRNEGQTPYDHLDRCKKKSK